MRNIKSKFVAIMFVAVCTGLFLTTGCRSKPMVSVSEVAFFDAPNKVELEKTTDKILTVGKRRHIPMKVIKPGEIEAVLIGRNRVSKATVTIKYDTERFSILYKNSEDLMYDPVKQTINHNYNNWVRRLEAYLTNIYVN